jgi:hypothetical protein
MPAVLTRNVWEDCRQAVAARLTATGLLRPDGTALPVVRQLFQDEQTTGAGFPLLLVSLDVQPAGPVRPRAFGFSDRTWPVAVTLHNRGDAARDDRLAAWYEQTVQGILNAFDPTLQDAVGSVWRVDLAPLNLERVRQQYQTVVAGVALRCVSTEPFAGVPAG